MFGLETTTTTTTAAATTTTTKSQTWTNQSLDSQPSFEFVEKPTEIYGPGIIKLLLSYYVHFPFSLRGCCICIIIYYLVSGSQVLALAVGWYVQYTFMMTPHHGLRVVSPSILGKVWPACPSLPLRRTCVSNGPFRHDHSEGTIQMHSIAWVFGLIYFPIMFICPFKKHCTLTHILPISGLPPEVLKATVFQVRWLPREQRSIKAKLFRNNFLSLQEEQAWPWPRPGKKGGEHGATHPKVLKVDWWFEKNKNIISYIRSH